MSEIKLKVQDQHLIAFLAFLKTLDYVSIQKVTSQMKNRKDAPLPKYRSGLSVSDPSNFIETPVEKTDLDALLKTQHYKGPNRKRFRTLVKTIAISEPIDQLLSQLSK